MTASSEAAAGVYCVTVSGADGRTEGATAIPDWFNDDTNDTSHTHVEWDSSSSDCAAPSDFEFETFVVTADTTGLVNTQTDEPFFFIVP